MALKTTKDIRYTNRTFDNIKKDILAFIKQAYPDFGNFGENSSSMMLVESQAAIADVLHYYIDEMYNELYLDTAKERKNLIALSKLFGYKYTGKRGSVANVDFFISVPAIDRGGGLIEPNSDYYLTIQKGSMLKSSTSPVQYFELIEDVNFQYVKNEDIKILDRINPDDGDSAPTTYLLRMTGQCANGRIKEETFTVSDFTRFYTISLTEPDVLEVINVTDSSANIYYEVDHLANDSVFVVSTNSATGDEKIVVPYSISLQKVSRRFIREVDENGISTLIFGAGPGNVSDDTLVPSPYQFILSNTAYSGNLLDPNNFLNTSTLGIGPANTTLTVSYRYGGGIESNVPANSITKFDDLRMNWPGVGVLTASDAVISSLEPDNLDPAQGGSDAPTIQELRYFASSTFAAQKRAVTLQDYIALMYGMPSKFGSIYRMYAQPSTGSDSSINLYCLTLDSNRNLVVPYDSLKQNIKNYISEYRMINDTVYINDGNIINIGIDFKVVISNSYNKSQVIGECILALQNKYDISNMEFNGKIVISEIYQLLQSINGIVSVVDIVIRNLSGSVGGRTYSSYIWNISSNTSNNIVYSNTTSIFEIKYPYSDIVGYSI